MSSPAPFNEELWFAIAEPSRRKLIELLLLKGEATASRLAEDVPFSRQAVSKHLAVLKGAGLVNERKTGKEVRFRLSPEGLSLAAQELSRAATLWDKRLQQIKHLAETLHQERKSTMETKTITKEQFIKETPERVFKALTEKQELERWFVQEAEIELKPGGTIRTNWAPGMGEYGKVREVKPFQLFSFTWEGAFSPTPTTLTFELTKEKDGTLLTFTHSGIGEGEGWDAYTNISKAWDAHLKDLTSWIETGTCPPPGPRG